MGICTDAGHGGGNLKNATNTKSKPTSSKAGKQLHNTGLRKKRGRLCLLTFILIISYTLHLCIHLCRCLRAKHTMGCLQKLLCLKLNLSFYEGNNKYSIKVISLSKKLDFICAGLGRAKQFTVQTS